MYCTQCGKQIESGILCEECLKKQELGQEEVASSEAQTQSVEQEVAVSEAVIETPVFSPSEKEVVIAKKGNRKAGLTKAIIGAVLGFVALIIVSTGLSIISTMADLLIYNTITIEAYNSALIVVAVLTFISIGISIPSLIFGISSIKTFKKEKSATGTKPIATLILGIVAIVYSACDMFASFILLVSSFLLV